MEVETINTADDPAHESLMRMSETCKHTRRITQCGVTVDLLMRYPVYMEAWLACRGDNAVGGLEGWG